MAKPPIFRIVCYDPESMAQRGRRGGQATAARHDSRETTQAARAAFNARFERDLDPLLPADERARLANEARQAYFRELGKLGVAVRRANRAAERANEEAVR